MANSSDRFGFISSDTSGTDSDDHVFSRFVASGNPTDNDGGDNNSDADELFGVGKLFKRSTAYGSEDGLLGQAYVLGDENNEHDENNANNESHGEVGGEAETLIWGTNISVERLHGLFTEFFGEFCVVGEYEPYYKRVFRSAYAAELGFINLDCQHLKQHDKYLLHTLVTYVSEVILIIDYVASELYTKWCGAPAQSLQVRPFNLDIDTSMRSLNPEDINKLVGLKGLVIRTSAVIPDMMAAYFACVLCKHSVVVGVAQGRIDEPDTCDQCNSKNSMDIIHNLCHFVDKQVLKLQEAPELIPEGQTPHTLLLVCGDDHIDTAQPGDRIAVTGYYRATTIRPNKTRRTIKAVCKTHIEVLHISKHEPTRVTRVSGTTQGSGYVLNIPSGYDQNIPSGYDQHNPSGYGKEDEKKYQLMGQRSDIYQTLVDSIAPSIYGHDDIKRGVLCQLFGGVNKSLNMGNMEESGGKCRGEINILLCGDPGTSKSQLLSRINKISARGIYTSGKGSSSVGLTAYVTKDPDTNEMVLESGALVLSDGGICCIDEFDKMSDQTRSVLHEVMEQQTVSIAKAGIICTLNARTSILAAANPIHSAWNPNLSIVDNIRLPPSLLSRFDLIYLVLDKHDEASDKRLANHLITMFESPPPTTNTPTTMETDRLFDAETLTGYISYAREKYAPIIPDAAMGLLVDGYLQMRQFGNTRNTVSATTRQLESLIRIAEALARMRLSHIVSDGDVTEAIRLVRTALCQSVTDPTTGLIDMSIITTGKSETTRNRITTLKRDIHQYLLTKQRPFQTSATLLIQAITNESDNTNTTQQDYKEAFIALKDDGVFAYDTKTSTVYYF